MKTTYAFAITLPLLLLAPSTSRARERFSPPAPVRIDRALSLHEAMQLAASRNLALLRNDLERRRVAAGYSSALGTFLPELSINTSYASLPSRTLSASGGSAADLPRDQRIRYGAAVTWKSWLGSWVSLGLNVDQSTRQQNNSSVALSAGQSLLRNGWRAGAANKLAEAKLDTRIQHALFRQQLNDLLVRVESAYWALAFAEADVKNRTRTRDRAKQQYLDTKENIRRGILAKQEIYVVEENLVIFEQQLTSSKQSLTLARRALAQLLIAAGSSKIGIADDLARIPAKAPNRTVAIRAGLAGNATLRAELLRAKKNRVQLAYQKNQALPALDLWASFRLNGLHPKYGTHLGEIFKADRPEASVGLTLTLPLSWRANRANVSRARFDLQKQLVALKRQEVRVRYLVGDQLARIAFLRRRLELAKRRLALSTKKLDFEVQKYKSGLSTLAVIVRFQREYDQAILAVRRRQLELRQNRATFAGLLGQMHTAHGITIGGRMRRK